MAKDRGECDPVYQKMIESMIAEHVADPSPSALVFVNSFDPEKDDIEEQMTERKLVAEVFEIDRVRAEDRAEYLNCFSALYGTKRLPLIFLKDQLVGGLSDLIKH